MPLVRCAASRPTLTPDNPQNQSYPTYDGDRILVAKFPYEFANPKRWDVIVFKYPGNATMNYIKRLVGLPGETISIHDGDLWIHKPGQPEGHFEIARKPPEKLLAMLQPVYDNDLAPTITGTLHWPARWTPEPGLADNAWTSKDLPRSRSTAAPRARPGFATGIACRRPSSGSSGRGHRRIRKGVWELTRDEVGPGRASNPLSPESVLPQLISDFTAYNTGDTATSRGKTEFLERVDRPGLRPALGRRPGRAIRSGVRSRHPARWSPN